jgi:hypothetical protein
MFSIFKIGYGIDVLSKKGIILILLVSIPVYVERWLNKEKK